MKFGMPTLLGCPDAESNAALCRRLGLQFVELNMNLPMFQADRLDALLDAAGRHGVELTLHLDENLDPANFNPLVSEAYLETLRASIRAAKRLGAPIVNMHMNKGVYFTLPEGKTYLYERYRDAYLSRIDALRSLCEREVRGSMVRVAIENTDGYLDFQREAILRLLESQAFVLTWDVGHSHRAKRDDLPFLLEHAHRIAHFHIHDANASGDHLALGEGDVDLSERLGRARAAGARCVIETKTVRALESSVAWLRERGWMDG